MSRPGFLDVSQVTARTGWLPGEESVTDGILVRDFAGRVVESLLIMPDGHFRSQFGRVHREDVGEYIIRSAGHPAAGCLAKT